MKAPRALLRRRGANALWVVVRVVMAVQVATVGQAVMVERVVMVVLHIITRLKTR
ncbi:hypothetical protein D3C75_1083020 [compost metagenome]